MPIIAPKLEPELSEWVTFAPEYMGNRDTEDPATMEIRPLSTADTMRYEDMINPRQEGGRTRDNTTTITARMLRENVRNLHGFFLEGPDGEKTEIKTPEELWRAPGLQPVIAEIQRALVDVSVLQEGQVKN